MLSSIQALQAFSPVAPVAAAVPVDNGTLDSRMIAELAQMSGAVSARQENLLAMMQSTVSDPNMLLGLQANVADFQVQMSVAASLARKAVGAIETLVKS